MQNQILRVFYDLGFDIESMNVSLLIEMKKILNQYYADFKAVIEDGKPSKFVKDNKKYRFFTYLKNQGIFLKEISNNGTSEIYDLGFRNGFEGEILEFIKGSYEGSQYQMEIIKCEVFKDGQNLEYEIRYNRDYTKDIVDFERGFKVEILKKDSYYRLIKSREVSNGDFEPDYIKISYLSDPKLSMVDLLNEILIKDKNESNENTRIRRI